MMKGSFKKTVLLFCGKMTEMILITIGFIMLGTKAVGIKSLIFLLIVLGVLVYQFIRSQRKHELNK